MFSEELILYSEGHHQKIQSSPTPPQAHAWHAQSEIEYEIFSSFMRKTGRELSHRESSLMDSSQQLIELYGHFGKK